MIKGKTLSELAAQIKREHGEKRDFILPTNLINYSAVAGGEFGAILFEANDTTLCVHPTRHCLRQIGERIGIPSKYLDRMVEEAQLELLATNINTWFKHKPETRMLRTMQREGGRHIARAFLSEKYRALDNYDLAEAVIPELLKAGCEILSSEITETRLYIQAATPRMQLDLNELRQSGKKLGEIDPVQAGVVISNSEVGSGSLRIEPMIYRLSCFNGLITSQSIRRAHVGRANVAFEELEAAAEYFSDSTRELDDKAFWAKVKDVVSGTFDLGKFTSLVEKFAATGEVKLESARNSVYEVQKQFRLSEGERESVLDHLIAGGDGMTLFGLVNAVTRTAEDATEYDRAIELERIGGQIIELPPTMWGTQEEKVD